MLRRGINQNCIQLFALSRSKNFPNVLSTRSFTDQKSQPKTLSNQHKIPKLPVAPLKETIEKFLLTAQPHVTDEEFAGGKSIQTIRKARDLVRPGGVGEKLHKGLQERSLTRDSWLSEWWLNAAYLEYREKLPVWSNPAFSFPLRKFTSLQDQVQCAAKITATTLDFKHILDNELLPPEYSGNQPLDMNQFYRLFGVIRFPESGKDRLSFHSSSKTIVLVHDNNFFSIQVIDDSGRRMTEENIEKVFSKVLHQSLSMGRGAGVALLTSQHRDNWTEDFRALKVHPVNASSIEAIEKALFVVSLDGSTEGFRTHLDPISKSGLSSLHGLGQSFNSGNRWFDKSLVFTISTDGKTGLNFEHSPSDGVALQGLTNHVIEGLDHGIPNRPDATTTKILNEPIHLKFVLNDQLKVSLDIASTSLQQLSDDLDLKVLVFQDFGKSFIKSWKFSPDSFAQMAIQYTFFKIHGVPGAHYESGSTRMFKEGRTETIRSCSNESVQFAKTMMGHQNKDIKYQSLVEAIRGHNNYAKQAVLGLGVDRLLLGLRLQAKETGVELPEFFNDPGVQRSGRMRLSTSQISSKFHDTYCCYGPLVPDGYAVCYGLFDDSMIFAIGSFNSNPETSNNLFHDTLSQCLVNMKDVCSAQNL